MISPHPELRPTLDEVKASLWMKEDTLDNANYMYEMQKCWKTLGKTNQSYCSN